MRQGFRPLLVPPYSQSHALVSDSRRPFLCLVVTLVVILLVITIFGMSAWNAYEHRFGKNTFVFYSGDEVALSQTASDFSATFCDSYKVSLQGAGQVFLLPSAATVNATAVEHVPVNIHQLPYREFNVVHKFLLQQSTVNVTACRRGGSVYSRAEIMLIQGDKNFYRWRRNIYCSDCVLRRVHIRDDAVCDHARQLPRLYHKITRDDRYFLFVFNGRPDSRPRLLSLGILLSGMISRTHFDLSDAEKTCYIVNSSSCIFTLPWGSTKDVVVKFGGPDSDSFRDTLSTSCQARVVFWVCLFGILPLVCIFVTLTSVYCFLRRKRIIITRFSRGCNDEMANERTRLLQRQNQQSPNYVPQNDNGGTVAIQQG
ncbi:unnamed protein product [Candidula unifasciata]|uniref:E3 ubiquitin-protein ligase APD1-4 middle domain-containing protein n=1 Tax=Candidula unifasciata TaxID=100452 RepID=A0A8S3YWA1_9EUPU|nr:unnamed protein product [Candidula unifasciata]